MRRPRRDPWRKVVATAPGVRARVDELVCGHALVGYGPKVPAQRRCPRCGERARRADAAAR